MTRVAVIAHRRKSLGRGLQHLRETLAREGVAEPLWYEIDKAKRATKRVREATDEGADLVFAWGGDGTVQRCVDGLPKDGPALAILPAGTANLLASHLGIPTDLEEAVRVGLHGARARIDVGSVNGKRFAVMAGAGYDARLMRDVDRRAKHRFGRLAYVWAGVRNLRAPRVRATVTVDGSTWFDGRAAMILFGNVGTLFGGIEVFEDARIDDGRLEVGVVTAGSVLEWSRALGRAVLGRTNRSPFVSTTGGSTIAVELDEPMPYELDGSDRKPTRRLTVRVEPAALEVCRPADRP